MRHSVVLERVSTAVLPTVVVFSLFLLLSGHNAPGGGFIGGLVAGAGLVLLWATGGPQAVRDAVPVRGTWLIGAGLFLAQLVAAAGWLLGGALLQSAHAKLHLPVFGDVKAATPLLFDLGVYLVVVGLISTVLTTLGAQLPSAAVGAQRPGAVPPSGDLR